MVNQEKMKNTKEANLILLNSLLKCLQAKNYKKQNKNLNSVEDCGAAQNQVCNIFSVKNNSVKAVTFGETKATGKCLSNKGVFRDEC